jgi:hypothetical protein
MADLTSIRPVATPENPARIEEKMQVFGKKTYFCSPFITIKQIIRDHEQLRIDGDFYPRAF